MKELTLTLTIEEVNIILDSLGNRPFKEVFGLINNIQNQASSQLVKSDQQVEMPK
jgi:hypothetical protein